MKRNLSKGFMTYCWKTLVYSLKTLGGLAQKDLVSAKEPIAVLLDSKSDRRGKKLMELCERGAHLDYCVQHIANRTWRPQREGPENDSHST